MNLTSDWLQVRIDAWPVSSQYPQGHFVSVVGRTGDLETEIDTILTENGVTVSPFSQVSNLDNFVSCSKLLFFLRQGILNELPPLTSCPSWRPDPEEVILASDWLTLVILTSDWSTGGEEARHEGRPGDEY